MIKHIVRGLAVATLSFLFVATAYNPQVNAQTQQPSPGFEACKANKILRYRRGRRMTTDPCVGRVQVFLDQVKWVRGSSGESVPNWHWPTMGVPDNLYGPRTEKAVIAYQIYKSGESGVADGIVGPDTWRSIRNTCVAWAHNGFRSAACY